MAPSSQVLEPPGNPGRFITPGPVCFNVHENTYRLDADVTPFLAHRRYTGAKDATGSWLYHNGAETRPADAPGKRIINWHEEHYREGVARNTATGRRFKRVTRILKQLRQEMVSSGKPAAKAAAEPIASFLIECLVFHAPDTCFNLGDDYVRDAQHVIAHLWNATKSDDTAAPLLEVSRMKYLFRPTQKWSRASANDFLYRAWEHGDGGFK